MDRLTGSPRLSCTLRTVVEWLEEPVLQVLSAPSGLEVTAGRPVILEEADEPVPEPQGILLLVTVRPTSPPALDAIRAAAQRGYAAVVIKLRDHDAAPLIDASETAGIAVLVAADDLPWHRLLALLTTALNVTDGEEEPSLWGEGMFSLANAIADAVGGAVAIENAAQDIVAYSNLPDQEIDKCRQQGILARRVPKLHTHIEDYQQLYRAGGVVRYPFHLDTGELPRAAIAVRAGTEILGSIWTIESTTPLRPQAERILEDAAKTTALRFLHARAASDVKRQAQNERLRALLQGHGSATALAGQLGIERDTPLVLLGFDFLVNGSIAPLNPRLSREIARFAAAVGAEIPLTDLGSSVYALVSLERSRAAGSRIAAGAAAHAESTLRHPVRAGISRVTADPLEIPDLRCEVDQILHVLSSDPAAPSVATAEQVHDRILLIRLSELLRRDMHLRHRAVQALESYDAERGTRYGASLLAYFDAIGDVPAAARQLNVHPNTLRYRLRRAASLFKIDLTSPDDRLLIWLQLRLATLGLGPGDVQRPV